MIRTISETLVAVGNSTELMLLLKTTFAIALGLTIAWLARKARASVRHLVLVSTLCVLVALPVAMMLVPQIAIEVQSASPVSTVSPTTSEATSHLETTSTVNQVAGESVVAISGVSSFSPRLFVFSFWALGVASFLASMGIGLWRLGRIRRSGLPWRESEGYCGI
jgi:hypothetical protein